MAPADPEVPVSRPRVPRAKGRLRRTTLHAGFVALRALVLLFTFVAATLAGVLLHIGLPPFERPTLAFVNGQLEPLFQGRVRVESVRFALPSGISGLELAVFDPENKEAARLKNVSVVWALLPTLRSLQSFEGPLRIVLHRITVEDAEVRLFQDPEGRVNIVRAFASRKPSPDDAPGRGTDLVIETLEVKDLRLRGALANLKPLDVDVHAFSGGLRVAPEAMRFRVDGVSLRGRALPRVNTAELFVSGRGKLPSDPRVAPEVNVSVDGRAAEVPFSVRLSYVNERVEAGALIEETAPERLTPLLGTNVGAPLDLIVLARGSRSALDAELTAGVGDGMLIARSELTLNESFELLAATLQARSSSLSVAGQRVPALRVDAELDGERGTALALAEEPGAEARLEADFVVPRAPSLEAPSVEYRLVAASPALERVERLEQLLRDADWRGSVALASQGRIQLTRPPHVDARLTLDAVGVRNRSASLGSARVLAEVRGAPANLVVEGRGELQELRVQTTEVAAARFAVSGPLTALRLGVRAHGPALPTVRAHAELDARAQVVRAPRIELEREGERIAASARQVRFANGRLAVDGAELGGAGDAKLQLRRSAKTLELRGRVERLELGRLARVLGVPNVIGQGWLTADLELALGHAEGRGFARGRFEELKIDGRLGAAEFDLNLEGVDLRGRVSAELAEVGMVRAAFEPITLRRGAPLATRASDLTGAARLDGEFDLAGLALLLPPESLPVSHARGRAAVHASVERSKQNEWPRAQVELSTHGLGLTGRRPETGEVESSEEARATRPWSSEELDAELRFDTSPDTREVNARLRLFDAKGDVLRAKGRSRAPEFRESWSAGAIRAAVLELPVEIDAQAPERAVEHWPPLLKPATLRGNVAAAVTARGSVREPELRLEVTGKALRPNEAARPFDVLARAEYRDDRAKFAAEVLDKQKRVLELRGDLLARLRDFLEAQQQAPNFSGNLSLSARDFDLSAVPTLSDRDMGGRLSGEVALKDWGRDARLEGKLRVAKLKLGRATFSEARARVAAGAGSVKGEIKLEEQAGFALARWDVPVSWGAELTPTLKQDEPLRTELTAKAFPAAALLPFVDGAVSNLGGRLDGRVRAEVDGDRAELRGALAFTEGVVQVPSLGQELRDVNARVRLEPGRITLPSARARGYTGRVEANGAVSLEGLAWREAQLHVNIPEGEEIPLTLEGVSVGDASGRIDVSAENAPAQRRTEVRVVIPSFHVDLPEVATTKVQSLEDDPRIRTGTYLPQQGFVELPLRPLEREDPDADPSTLRVSVRFGKEVWIRRGAQLRARVAGGLTLIQQGGETRIEGKLNLPRGHIDVSGKLFEIDTATVSFNPQEPNNPVVVATARWDSPEGYRVFADYAGPVNGGRLSLRSEPSLQQNEILSLLLFGTPDGQFGVTGSGDSDSGAAAAAVSVGGGAATKALNRALSDLTSLDVQTRVDTSRGTPAPEIALQLTPRVTAELGYSVGNPAPGQPPDRTFLTLETRVRRRWSVATTVGDRGSTLWEVLWRYLY
jgi:translocation and assembly module TamB